jgi:hypothetical protein
MMGVIDSNYSNNIISNNFIVFSENLLGAHSAQNWQE